MRQTSRTTNEATTRSRRVGAPTETKPLRAGLTLRDAALCLLPIALMLAVVVWLSRS